MNLLKVFAFSILMISSSSFAAAPEMGDFKGYLESLSAVDGVLFPMAMQEASIESLRAIRKSMMTTEAPFPKLSLKNDEITVNGKATGVTVMAVSPLSLKYKGEVWSFDTHQPVDENYFRLLKTLKVSAQKSRTFWMFSPAYAAGGASSHVYVAGAAAGWQSCGASYDTVLHNFPPAILGAPLAYIGCGFFGGISGMSNAQIICNSRNMASFTWIKGTPAVRAPNLDMYCPRSKRTAWMENKMNSGAKGLFSLTAPNPLHKSEIGNTKGGGAGM